MVETKNVSAFFLLYEGQVVSTPAVNDRPVVRLMDEPRQPACNDVSLVPNQWFRSKWAMSATTKYAPARQDDTIHDAICV